MSEDGAIPEGDVVYRIAQLPNLTPEQREAMNVDWQRIGSWYFRTEKEPPHELSVFHGLEPEQARTFRRFKEEGKDEEFIPFRRAIEVHVSVIKDIGQWAVLHSPIREHPALADNENHAGVVPWAKGPYKGNFTHDRNRLIDALQGAWATPVDGTAWEDL